MAQQSLISPICGICKRITFVDLCRGFEHELTYRETIESGRTCKFCRLMVCSFSRRQVLAKAYEVNNDYEAFIPQLLHLPMIARQQHPVGNPHAMGFPLTEHFIDCPNHLSWQVLHGMSKEGEVHGCFNDGSTITLTAPEGSAFLCPRIIETREIDEANCERNNSLLYTWLRNCVDYHMGCRISFGGSNYDDSDTSGPILPTRVIDIGPIDGSEAPRILNTEGKRGAYIALSHRWGKARMLRTEKSNISAFQKCLPVDQLPKTFRDAIAVTRCLAERYLWIDSLCIVQDDRDDWEKEAKNMGTVFERAICTIAAVDAVDDITGLDGGLFLPRVPDPLAVRLDCNFCAESELPPKPDDPFYTDEETGETTFQSISFSESSLNKDIVLRPRWKGLLFTMEETLWYSRGWVFQERLLSRRIIYYTSRKIFWECLEEANDEENIIKDPPKRAHYASELERLACSFRRREKCASEQFAFWWFIIAEYSKCKLTKVKDKLTALLGLCEIAQLRIQRPIFAGILSDEAGLNLLWRVEDDGNPINNSDFHAPSWSWASSSGWVTYYSIYTRLGQSRTSNIAKDIHFTRAPECRRIKERRGLSCPHGSSCDTITMRTLVAKAIACENLEATGWEDNENLINVLGTGVHCEKIHKPRRELSGNYTMGKRHLSLPRRTRVLRDERYYKIIGWFVPDKEPPRRSSPLPLICAAIVLHQASEPPSGPLIHRVVGFDYNEEELVDFVALLQVGIIESNQQPVYERELGAYEPHIMNNKTSDERIRYRNIFVWELARHSIGEEIVVYPAMEKHLNDGRDMASKDRDQHQTVRGPRYTCSNLGEGGRA
ncbi:HET-domain-containing protein [Rostrohypoxylon terebratum]|nr:HET-domain-containing protein [Rostrohypoxylon terebratum]